MSSSPTDPGARVRHVFLDRDGTINRKAPEGDYVTSAAQWVALPRAIEAIRLLNEAGIEAIVVTNQRGIALGRMTEADLAAIHERMGDELEAGGARVDAVYHCPHEEDACDCRKPRTGMFERAARDRPGLDFRRSAVVGDSWRDVEAGRSIGAVTVLLAPAGDGADHVAPSLYDAVLWLLDGGGASSLPG